MRFIAILFIAFLSGCFHYPDKPITSEYDNRSIYPEGDQYRLIHPHNYNPPK